VVVDKVRRFFMSSAIFFLNGRTEVKCNKVCELLQKAYGEYAMKKKQVPNMALKTTNTPVDPARQ
jgi:hypothetical protein